MANSIALSLEVIQAGAALGTLGIAFLVFFEAKRIRKADGIFRQNQAWNEFGRGIAEFDKGSRVGLLLMGREVGPGVAPINNAGDLTITEAFLLMSFFNVVSSEYAAVRGKAIDEKYVIHSLTMTHGLLKRTSNWVFDFLEQSGYEQSFIACLRMVEKVGSDVGKLESAIRDEFRAVARQLKEGCDSADPRPR
jgi:hypothetical protein